MSQFHLAPGARYIPNALRWAQVRYMERTGCQISQTEIQRLSWRLEAGDTIIAAVDWVWHFFNVHSQAFEYSSNFEPGQASQAAYDEFVFNHALAKYLGY